MVSGIDQPHFPGSCTKEIIDPIFDSVLFLFTTNEIDDKIGRDLKVIGHRLVLTHSTFGNDGNVRTPNSILIKAKAPKSLTRLEHVGPVSFRGRAQTKKQLADREEDRWIEFPFDQLAIDQLESISIRKMHQTRRTQTRSAD